MDNGKSHRKSRRRFLGGSAQGGLVLRVYGVICLALAVAASLVYLLANRHLEESYLKAHLTIGSTLEGLGPWIFLANLLGLVAVFLVILRFTLSVAGPEYRLCRILETIQAGRLVGRVQLRRGDQLDTLASSIETLSRSLSRRFREVEKAREEISHLADGGEEGEVIRRAVASLDTALSGVRLDGREDR